MFIEFECQSQSNQIHHFSSPSVAVFICFCNFSREASILSGSAQEDMTHVSLVSFIHHTFPCFQHSKEATLFLRRTKLLDLNSRIYCLIDLNSLMIATLD